MPVDPQPAEPSSVVPLEPPKVRSARRLILAGWALAGLALVILVVTLRLADSRGGTPTATVDRPAPAFELWTIHGERLSFDSLRGSPIVLNFWAPWCVPCREEVPLLTAAAAAYESVRFVGVVYQDSSANAQSFATEMGQTYPAVLDPDGRTAIDYGVVGIPMTFFIDATGTIRSRQIGGITAADLHRQVEAILP